MVLNNFYCTKLTSMDGRVLFYSYCTIYQLLQLFLADKLVSQSQRWVWTYILSSYLQEWKMLSHTYRLWPKKGNKILVAFCESNKYSSSTLNQENKRAFWLKLITKLRSDDNSASSFFRVVADQFLQQKKGSKPINQTSKFSSGIPLRRTPVWENLLCTFSIDIWTSSQINFQTNDSCFL